MRDLWGGRATLAQQKASVAVVSAVEVGLADGTKTRDDVTTLHGGGIIGDAKRDELYEWADAAEKDRTQKVEGRNRVQSVLD